MEDPSKKGENGQRNRDGYKCYACGSEYHLIGNAECKKKAFHVWTEETDDSAWYNEETGYPDHADDDYWHWNYMAVELPDDDSESEQSVESASPSDHTARPGPPSLVSDDDEPPFHTWYYDPDTHFLTRNPEQDYPERTMWHRFSVGPPRFWNADAILRHGRLEWIRNYWMRNQNAQADDALFHTPVENRVVQQNVVLGNMAVPVT